MDAISHDSEFSVMNLSVYSAPYLIPLPPYNMGLSGNVGGSRPLSALHLTSGWTSNGSPSRPLYFFALCLMYRQEHVCLEIETCVALPHMGGSVNGIVGFL